MKFWYTSVDKYIVLQQAYSNKPIFCLAHHVNNTVADTANGVNPFDALGRELVWL